MAALSITAASVIAASDAGTEWGIAGETITAGQLVYRLASDGELYLAQADAAATDAVLGVALHAASDGQPLKILQSGQLTINDDATAGVVYCLDDAVAGAIVPWADLTADGTDYLTIIGPALSGTVLDVNIQTTSITLPTP